MSVFDSLGEVSLLYLKRVLLSAKGCSEIVIEETEKLADLVNIAEHIVGSRLFEDGLLLSDYPYNLKLLIEGIEKELSSRNKSRNKETLFAKYVVKNDYENTFSAKDEGVVSCEDIPDNATWDKNKRMCADGTGRVWLRLKEASDA